MKKSRKMRCEIAEKFLHKTEKYPLYIDFFFFNE